MVADYPSDEIIWEYFTFRRGLVETTVHVQDADSVAVKR